MNETNNPQEQQPTLEQAQEARIVIGYAGAGANQIAVLAGDIFKGIDFSGLVNAVEAIAGKAGQLDHDEKQAAIAIIGDWENGVNRRLQDKLSEMNEFLGFFETKTGKGYNSTGYDDMLEELGNTLAQKTNTVAEYETYMDTRSALERFEQTRPDEPEHDGNTTPIQKIRKDADYQKAKSIYDLQHQKLMRVMQKSEIAWKTLLRENTEVKDLMRQARNYNKNVGKFKTECHEKGQLAKLNINIASADVRGALKDLVNFTKTI